MKVYIMSHRERSFPLGEKFYTDVYADKDEAIMTASIRLANALNHALPDRENEATDEEIQAAGLETLTSARREDRQVWHLAPDYPGAPMVTIRERDIIK